MDASPEQSIFPLVSVMIITRDREELLRKCVRSIIDNTYKKIELVILDNGSGASKRRIGELLSSLDTKCVIRHIETSPKGFAQMRQEALGHCEGEMVMSIDDDCEADTNAISKVVERLLADPTIGVVGGNLKNIGFERNEKYKGRGKLGINAKYEISKNPEEADVFGGANMSLRRKAVEEAGGYDAFFSAGLEESDLILSIKEAGYKIVYEPGIIIKHFHSPSKFRSRWSNMDMHRLYLFLKHFMPRSLNDWIVFGGNEWNIFADDLCGMGPQLRSREKLRKIRSSRKSIDFALLTGTMLMTVCVAVAKMIVARLAVPYLVLKAYRIRKCKKRRNNARVDS